VSVPGVAGPMSASSCNHLTEEEPEGRQARSTWASIWLRLRRNRVAMVGLAFILFIIGLAVLGPSLYPRSPTEIDLINRYALPSLQAPLGTDESGRDVLARVMHGSRISLSVGLLAAGLSVALGSLVGCLAGYFGGAVDHLLMRFTDGLLSIPIFFLLLVVVTLLGSTVSNVILALGLTRWMGVARLVRGEVLRYRAMDFILAARSVGARDRRIMFAHLLPQASPSIIVAATLGMARVILVESSLSYLGLGVQPPTATWGNMLSNSQNYIWNAPQLALYPGLLILLTVLAFNALGDGLRDALDPFMIGRN